MSARPRLFLGRLSSSLRLFSLLFFVLSIIPSVNFASDTLEAPSPLVKLDLAGEALGIDAKQWSCVMDEDTGLIWEKRDPTTALHGHDNFIWYQPEQSDPGSQRAHLESDWADSTCYGFNSDDPSSFCNTNAYADRVNQSNYCGYSDWRLPTTTELLTLVEPNLKQSNITPLIDTSFFPFHKPFAYWTSTVNEDGIVETIFSDDEVLTNSERSDSILIRLVRGHSQ